MSYVRSRLIHLRVSKWTKTAFKKYFNRSRGSVAIKREIVTWRFRGKWSSKLILSVTPHKSVVGRKPGRIKETIFTLRNKSYQHLFAEPENEEKKTQITNNKNSKCVGRSNQNNYTYIGSDGTSWSDRKRRKKRIVVIL